MYCDSIDFDRYEYICYPDVGGKPWYGGDVGCGLYAMQLVDDWTAKGWTIGASYCDIFHDDTGGTYVAVGGWFTVPVQYLGFLYCSMFGYFASNLRVGAWNCDYTWTSISGLTYLGVGGWLDYHYLGHDGISAFFRIAIFYILPGILVLVITFGVIFPVYSMPYMVAGALMELTVVCLTYIWTPRLGL